MSVDVAFPAALWALFAATGIRPEWIVPVLYSESGLNPAIQNAEGAPYYGINQASASYLEGRGIAVSDYTTWSASQQLAEVVQPMMESNVKTYGPLRSGTRVYQANFLPATLPSCKSLTSVLATKSGGGECWTVSAAESASIYTWNPGLDFDRSGKITVDSLAHFVAKEAANSNVQQILADAYAVAPAGAGTMTDPVYGQDFSRFGSLWVWSGVLAATAGLVTWKWDALRPFAQSAGRWFRS